MSDPNDLSDVRASATAEPTASERARARDRAERDTRPPVVRHATRFQFLTGALVFVAVAATALAFVFAVSGGGQRASSQSPWAAFKPSSDGLDTGAREIADYVGRQYRLPTGDQIVLVTGGPLELQNLPLKIVMRQSPADGGSMRLVGGKGVLYRMCGLGPKCAIDKGTPTEDRALLLHREALELALYSFHDLDDVDNVVVFMPPPKGKDPEQALYFGRNDVAGQLARPLRATLPQPVPTPATVKTAPNANYVQQLTAYNIFKASLTESNRDASAFLVLDPPDASS